jgi:hypothetical protein
MYQSFVSNFMSGAIAMGYLVVGLLFLKFWRRTRDSFFMMFAGAFWLLAVNQAAFTLSDSGQLEQGAIYLLRLAAFALIIIAIVQKNLRTTERR